MSKIRKVETYEEFLARGGKPVIIPPQESPDEEPVVKSTVGGLPEIMSLTDGEHFFAEKRKQTKKKVTKEEFADKVSGSSLPPEIMNSLLSKIGIKNGG